MPYAANNQISTSLIEGGIEITTEQYGQALTGMKQGKLVSVDAGFALVDQPEPEAPPAPEPIEPGPPQSVTRRQGRLALLDAGKLLEVENMIAAMADPTERLTAQVEYEADTWERSNAFLQYMWAQLGGTEAQLDDLFILAASK